MSCAPRSRHGACGFRRTCWLYRDVRLRQFHSSRCATHACVRVPGFGGLNVEVDFAKLPFTPSYFVDEHDTGQDAVSVRYFVRLTVRTGWTEVRRVLLGSRVAVGAHSCAVAFLILTSLPPVLVCTRTRSTGTRTKSRCTERRSPTSTLTARLACSGPRDPKLQTRCQTTNPSCLPTLASTRNLLNTQHTVTAAQPWGAPGLASGHNRRRGNDTRGHLRLSGCVAE